MHLGSNTWKVRKSFTARSLLEASIILYQERIGFSKLNEQIIGLSNAKEKDSEKTKNNQPEQHSADEQNIC